MNLKEKYVITINRELGSGGRTIGKMLADRLGVPFYDKALIQELEKKYDLTAPEIERLKGQQQPEDHAQLCRSPARFQQDGHP